MEPFSPFVEDATSTAQGINLTILTDHFPNNVRDIPIGEYPNDVTTIPVGGETTVNIVLRNPQSYDLELALEGEGSGKASVKLADDKQSVIVTIANPARLENFDLTMTISANGRPMPACKLPKMQGRFFDASLESLSVYPGVINPGFTKSPDISAFSADIPNGTTSLEVTAAVPDGLFSSYTVNGLTPDENGKTIVALNPDTNSIPLIVTADCGVTKQYNINLYKLGLSLSAQPNITSVYRDAPPSVTVTISNNGTNAVNVTDVSLSNVVDFSTAGFSGPIPIGGTGTFTVTPNANLKVTGSPYVTKVFVTYDAGDTIETRELDITFTVTQRPITISGGVTAVNRVYDGTTTVALSGDSASLVGVLGGDSVGFTLGNGTIYSASVGDGKAVSTNIQLTGDDAPNYSLTQPVGITVNILPITLTYDGNDQESGTVPPASTYDEETIVTVSDNTGSLARTGYSFNGWNTAADGSGTPYAAGDTFTINADVTLFAQWVLVYSVTVNNGIAIGSYPEGATVTITANQSAGSMFNYWTIISGDIELANDKLGKTTFTMPATAVEVSAIFQPAPHAVGDTGPGGGTIFYFDPLGFEVQGYGNLGDPGYFATYVAHYLEGAPSNSAGGANVEWGAYRTTIPNISGYEDFSIGNGRRDTQLIVAYLEGRETGRAAQLCVAETFGGLNDWFLPSLGEAWEYVLWYRADRPNTTVPWTGGGNPSAIWTSTQNGSDNAYTVNFTSGVNARERKDNYNTPYKRAHAIRAF